MDVPFPDNWTYLRTELNWLDRVLANTIARQRKETKEVNRVARSPLDRATSHWWQGLINLDGVVASDSPVDAPKRGSTKRTYQQQMEARIRASQEKGIILGLPSLCQRLSLSTFEKNLVLIALAPEVSRRYERIYRLLQEPDQPQASGLPSVDLVLRLLCRNDAEWRSARLSLTGTSKLVEHQIVLLPDTHNQPFLAHSVKLADPIVEYLLAEQPQLPTLESLLQAALNSDDHEVEPLSNTLDTWIPTPIHHVLGTHSHSTIAASTSIDAWTRVILPERQLIALQHWCDRIRYAELVDEAWGFRDSTDSVGTIAQLIGAKGTGKTTVARAIAQTLNVPLVTLDLVSLNPAQSDSTLQHLLAEAPTVLLVKSAQRWFGRTTPLPTATLHHFLQERQRSRSITLLSLEPPGTMRAMWQPYLTDIVQFPLPTQQNRQKLWKQSFPSTVPLAADIDWHALSKQPYTGGEIVAIAREAAIYAATDSVESKLSMKHILKACQNRTHRALSETKRKQSIVKKRNTLKSKNAANH
ncbi:AAA+ family ATPase [Leptolyngbyaceae cyanobacterium JSC-12]|nr:AAA+ family ATPase [Leptolyngbyaceae cyanobacterium JSC-12]